MKTLTYFICAVILASSLSAHGQLYYTGSTYEVEIVRNNGSVSAGACITFDQNGRFTMSDATLTMIWAPQEHFPNQFMAATAPGERTVVPYHKGVYGTVLPNKSIKGRGIDQTGNPFVFHGQASDDCGDNPSERATSNSNQANPEDLAGPREGLNPMVNPCSQSHCDPIPNPLRASNQHDQELNSTLTAIHNPCSQLPCDPIPNPLRANSEHDQELNLSLTAIHNPCSQLPCDPIPNPLRANSEHDQELNLSLTAIHNPCSQLPCGPIPNSLRANSEHDQELNLSLTAIHNSCSQQPCGPIPNSLRANSEHDQELNLSLTAIHNSCSQQPCGPIPNSLRANSEHDQELNLSLTAIHNSCSQQPCGPIRDPLDVGTETITTSTIAGRSFQLTLGTSDQSVLEYCWTFGNKHEIHTAHNEVFQWSPVSSAYDVAGFQSVGAGANGQGLSYHGALVGYGLLEVVGIEAHNGASVVTYGFGQQVTDCQ